MEKHIKKNKLRCRLCNDTIESKSRHDFNYCKCGKAFIDGGREYVRYGADNLDLVEILTEYYTDEEWAKHVEWYNSPEIVEKRKQIQAIQLQQLFMVLCNEGRRL